MVPVRLERATVPVHVGQRSRLLPQTGTNALATNMWRTARHWSRLLAKTGTVALAISAPSQHFAIFPQKISGLCWGGVGARIFYFDCTPGVRRNVQATLRSS